MARLKPSDRIDVDVLEAALKKAKAEPAYVLAGTETFFRCRALELLRGKVLGKAGPSLGLAEYEGKADPREVLDGLRTPGLFARGRMAVVDPAEEFVAKHGEAVARYVGSPAEDACLVLVVGELSGRGGRGGGQPDRVGAAVAKLRGCGCPVVACEGLRRPQDAQRWVAARARHYGKRLEAGAAKALVETAGRDLAVLDRHLQNLSAYAGERGSIGPEEVEELVGGDPQRWTYELTNALAEARAGDALRILGQMVTQGESAPSIVRRLGREFSRLWQVKRMVRDGAGDEALMSLIGTSSAYRVKMVKEEAGRIHPARLLAAHQILLETDVASKTSAMPEEMLLELMVLKICGGEGTGRG